MFRLIGIITMLLLDLIITLSTDEFDSNDFEAGIFILNFVIGMILVIVGIINNSINILIGIYLISLVTIESFGITFNSIKDYIEERKKNE